MGAIDYIILSVIIAIVGSAVYYIYRSKKSGKKCIGCPDSGSCSGSCQSCACGCGKQYK
jgi:hypothetical protein